MRQAAVTGVMIGVGALATAGEIGIAVLLPRNFASLPELLGAHAVISLLLLLTAATLYTRGCRDPSFLLLTAATPIMGPVGAIGGAVGAVLCYLFSLRATPFEEWYTSLNPALELTPATLLYERLVLHRGEPASRSTVTSFRDVMALGTVQQKQIVLTAIGDKFRPEFAPALKSALSDVEPAVRVQAASVSARIEGGHFARSLHLEARRRADRDNVESLLALARHYDEWADTQLLDPARAVAERTRALDYYRQVEAAQPNDAGVLDAIGRLLLRLDHYREALVYLERGAARPDAPPAILVLHLECLFQIGGTFRLRRAARAYWPRIALANLPDDTGEAVRAWVDGAADPAVWAI